MTDNVSLSLFFAYLGTLWFGCSNAAQEIVREVAIYRRERMVGLGRHSYLLSKFLLLGTLTAIAGPFPVRVSLRGELVLISAGSDGPEQLRAWNRGISGSPLWEMGSHAVHGLRGGRHRVCHLGAGAQRNAGGDDRAAGAHPANLVLGPGGGNRSTCTRRSCTRLTNV